MEKNKNLYQQHLFICTNLKEDKSTCGSRGSEELRQKVKELAKAQLGDQVRVNSAGCLGHCSRGIVAVVYPQGQWFFDLTKEDVAPLKEAITNSQNSETP